MISVEYQMDSGKTRVWRESKQNSCLFKTKSLPLNGKDGSTSATFFSKPCLCILQIMWSLSRLSFFKLGYIHKLIVREINSKNLKLQKNSTVNPLNTLDKQKDTHGKMQSLNYVKIREKDEDKGLNLSYRFRLFPPCFLQ